MYTAVIVSINVASREFGIRQHFFQEFPFRIKRECEQDNNVTVARLILQKTFLPPFPDWPPNRLRKFSRIRNFLMSESFCAALEKSSTLLSSEENDSTATRVISRVTTFSA